MTSEQRNLRVTLEYQGTRYRGFQIQSSQRTVAGELLAAVERMSHERPRIFAAGRTDAGVHAFGQVANFYTRSRLPVIEIREKLNDELPKDIAILRVDDVPASFHARHSARQRIYVYRISTRRTAFLKDLAWWVRSKLDIEAMSAAAASLQGRRDFSSFADKENLPEDPVLTLFEATVTRQGTNIELRFRAERFLARMVRRMVGVLVKVGQGKLAPHAVVDIFERPLPEVAEWTAPPWGLFLESVIYDDRAGAAVPYRKGEAGVGEILVWRP